jgi:hypothetical protein
MAIPIAMDRRGPGRVPILPPQRGGDCLLPQDGRRVVGDSAMFGFRPLPLRTRATRSATAAARLAAARLAPAAGLVPACVLWRRQSALAKVRVSWGGGFGRKHWA